MVTPAWLKAGFTTAASSSTGSVTFRLNRTALGPLSTTAYQIAPVRETARHTGCISTME